MPVHKFANGISYMKEEFQKLRREKGRKYLFGPNVFIWSILGKKK